MKNLFSLLLLCACFNVCAMQPEFNEDVFSERNSESGFNPVEPVQHCKVYGTPSPRPESPTTGEMDKCPVSPVPPRK